MTPPVLTTARLTMGPAAMDHLAAFTAFVQTDHSRFMGGPGDADDAWDSVTSHAGQWALRGYGTFWVRLTATGEPVGRVGIYHPVWLAEAELSWVIYAAHIRQGYATEAATAARDWASARGLPPLTSLIDPANSASAALAGRLGAVIDGSHTYGSGKVVDRWRHPMGARP
jgi:RimJ/RimL family protein N-acetyltransferase